MLMTVNRPLSPMSNSGVFYGRNAQSRVLTIKKERERGGNLGCYHCPAVPFCRSPCLPLYTGKAMGVQIEWFLLGFLAPYASVFVFLATPVLLCLLVGGRRNRNHLCLDHLPVMLGSKRWLSTSCSDKAKGYRLGMAWLGTARHGTS